MRHGSESLHITSVSNPKIKEFAKIHDRSHRLQTGLCFVEGYDEVAHAVKAGAKLINLFVCKELMRGEDSTLIEEARRLGAGIFDLSPNVMQKLSYREHPDAWLLMTECPSQELSTLALRIGAWNPLQKRQLIVIAEDIEKPGNIGAIVRSADAVRASAVIAINQRTDFGNPNVIRASKSSIFNIPLASASLSEVLTWLDEHRVKIVAASPEAKKSMWESDLSGNIAIVVGAEHQGLSEEWDSLAHEKVQIPMTGSVNSLNVAQSATLLLYEASRQGLVNKG